MASPVLDSHGLSASNYTLPSGVSTANLSSGITTSNSPDTILVWVAYEVTTGTPSVSGVTSTHLTFSHAGTVVNTTSGAHRMAIELWSAPAASTLTNEVITVNWTGTIDDAAIAAIPYTGLFSVSAPFDSNVGLPATAFNTTSTTPPTVTFSTTQSDDLLLAATFSSTGQSVSATVPTGWTYVLPSGALANGGGTNFCIGALYQQSVSSPQSGATFQANFNASGLGFSAIVTAITADNASPGSVGTIGLNIAVAGVGTNLQSGAGSVGLNIAVAGVAEAIVNSTGTVGLNIAVAGVGEATSASTGTIGLNIAVAGAGESTAVSVGTIGLNIAVAGVGESTAKSAGTIGLNINVEGVGAGTGSVSTGFIGLKIGVFGAGSETGRMLPFDYSRAWSLSINGSIIAAVQYDPITSVLRVLYANPSGLTIDIGNLPISVTNAIEMSPNPQAYILGLVAQARN